MKNIVKSNCILTECKVKHVDFKEAIQAYLDGATIASIKHGYPWICGEYKNTGKIYAGSNIDTIKSTNTSSPMSIEISEIVNADWLIYTDELRLTNMFQRGAMSFMGGQHMLSFDNNLEKDRHKHPWQWFEKTFSSIENAIDWCEKNHKPYEICLMDNDDKNGEKL